MTVGAALALLKENSLSSAIEREIEGMILHGTLGSDEKINEIQLAERFGVSRSPVREALRALEAGGLVMAVPNRGVFIRRIEVGEAVEVYGVRAALFGYAGQMLASGGRAVDLERLRELHAEMAASVEAHRFDDYYPLNFAFHELIVDASRNRVLAAQYRSLVKQLRLFRAGNLMSGDTLSISHREHQAIVDAVLARDPAAAYRACFHHVEMGKGRLMARAAKDARPGATANGGDARSKPAAAT